MLLSLFSLFCGCRQLVTFNCGQTPFPIVSCTLCLDQLPIRGSFIDCPLGSLYVYPLVSFSCFIAMIWTVTHLVGLWCLSCVFTYFYCFNFVGQMYAYTVFGIGRDVGPLLLVPPVWILGPVFPLLSFSGLWQWLAPDSHLGHPCAHAPISVFCCCGVILILR